MRRHVSSAIALAAAALAVAACSAASPATATAPSATAATHAAKPAKTVKAAATKAPAKSCSPTFDYLVYSTEPGTTPVVAEIGNLDLATCQSSLDDFQATAGQGAGECTTIALASSNPGYNVNAADPAPLKGVIESAGPGC